MPKGLGYRRYQLILGRKTSVMQCEGNSDLSNNLPMAEWMNINLSYTAKLMWETIQTLKK